MIEIIKKDKNLWSLFAREEEYSADKLDKYGRFPYGASKDKSVLEPKVSEYLVNNGLNIQYPNNKKFAVCLTHDIDLIDKRKKEYLKDSAKMLRELDLNGAAKNLAAVFDQKNSPLQNFKNIVSMEKKYGAKSSFYFLALKESDLDYNFDIASLKEELREIAKMGWEVGLHGGHNAYNNLEVLLEEKKRLEDAFGMEVKGYRNHYLRFKTPDTWELLSEAGFKYDTTLGYAETVGFRNGMCHPFKPYNLKTCREIEIIEIPLVIMDRTFLSYMNLNPKEAWKLTKRLIDVTEKNRGVITILWHNNQMRGKMGRLYEKILRYCNERNAWMTSGKEIYTFWINKT